MKTESMHIKNDQLYIGEYSLEKLALDYKTPLYVYDEKQILNKIKRFKNSFTSQEIDCHVVYASKAFIAPRLCYLLREQGLYIDAISYGDLCLLERAKFDFSKVILHGNNKSDAELEMAVKNNIGYIVCDNYIELERLEKICATLKKKANTLFRVNPGIEAHTHAFIQTSLLDSKFGESVYDLARIDEIVEFYKKAEYLVFDGFHAHIGSQINNESSFISLVKTMVAFAKQVSEKHQITIETINFGGGFSIKYLDDDEEINLEQTLRKMVETCLSDMKSLGLNLKRIFIEPGRSIVGDAGVTIYTCGGTKKTFAGIEYAFIDGGMGDNIRPALYEAKYTFMNASKCHHEQPYGIYNIAGKCCESGDIIGKGIKLAQPSIGDIIVAFSTGAYCYSMSMNYNMLTRGGVIFVNDSVVYEVIRREDSNDLLKTYMF